VVLSPVENTFQLRERAQITGIYKQVKICPQGVTFMTHVLPYIKYIFSFLSLSRDSSERNLLTTMIEERNEKCVPFFDRFFFLLLYL